MSHRHDSELGGAQNASSIMVMDDGSTQQYLQSGLRGEAPGAEGGLLTTSWTGAATLRDCCRTRSATLPSVPAMALVL
jgi:hypothetical protein